MSHRHSLSTILAVAAASAALLLTLSGCNMATMSAAGAAYSRPVFYVPPAPVYRAPVTTTCYHVGATLQCYTN
jgi:hypothetical protein